MPIFEAATGAPNGERFSVFPWSVYDSPIPDYVPVDPDFAGNGDGTWTAFGEVVRTPELEPAIHLPWSETLVRLEGALPKNATVARVTGAAWFASSGTRSWDPDMLLVVTHVDGSLDRRSEDALIDRANEASTRAARELGDDRASTLGRVRYILLPVRDIFVQVFGADVGRAQLYSAILATAGELSPTARAYALAEAATVGPVDDDHALRHAAFAAAGRTLAKIALSEDPDAFHAATVLWQTMGQMHERPPSPEAVAAFMRFRDRLVGNAQ